MTRGEPRRRAPPCRPRSPVRARVRSSLPSCQAMSASRASRSTRSAIRAANASTAARANVTRGVTVRRPRRASSAASTVASTSRRALATSARRTKCVVAEHHGDGLAGRAGELAPDERARLVALHARRRRRVPIRTPSAIVSSLAARRPRSSAATTSEQREHCSDADATARSIAAGLATRNRAARRSSGGNTHGTPRKPASPTMAGMNPGVVIVGGGIAGQAVCEALRERDRDVAITLVCGEAARRTTASGCRRSSSAARTRETLAAAAVGVVRRQRRRAARRPDRHVGRRRARRARPRRHRRARASTSSSSRPARSR